MSGLEEDIAAWQADWNLPAEILVDLVRRTTGSGIARDERILEGHGNEVHAVLTDDGDGVVVRVARRSGPAFDRECWPLEVARRVGLPVPEVLLVEHTSLDGREVSFNVQTRLPGSSVYRLQPSLSDAELAALTRQAGSLLARVHAIDPPGRGPIGPDGEIDLRLSHPGHDVVASVIERSPYLVDNGMDRSLVDRVEQVVVSNAELLARSPIRLVHGDWRTTNLLSDGRLITGVVDWEGVRGDDPAHDFTGAWHLRQRSVPTSMDLLLAAYRHAGGEVDAEFEVRRLVYGLADLHSALAHFIFTNRPDLLALAVDDLQAQLLTGAKLC